jgi:hypothetical protein
VGDGAADVLVSAFAGFCGQAPDMGALQREAERIVRPGGRFLVLHDYARDDAVKLLHDADEERALIAWSQRDGWFLAHGYKLRVLHCWWTWDSVEDARCSLERVFGVAGAKAADELRRPRLEHKVAVYHRTLGEPMEEPGPGS